MSRHLISINQFDTKELDDKAHDARICYIKTLDARICDVKTPDAIICHAKTFDAKVHDAKAHDPNTYKEQNNLVASVSAQNYH